MKRKDSNGRILKEGESQRKNGTYSYRYTDKNGKRVDIYAKTLNELRAKKEEIIKSKTLGIDTTVPTTLGEQIKYCIDLRTGLKESTRLTYHSWFKGIESHPVMKVKLTELKSSQLKEFVSDMQKEGKSFNTISSCFTGLIRPALDQAVEDEILVRNPGSFEITSVARKQVKEIRALTDYEVECFESYLNQDGKIPRGNKCLMLLTLETGLRAAEVAALTIHDIDFDRNVIRVNKQLKLMGRKKWIDTVKSASGVRYIPMSKKCIEYITEAMRDISTDEIDGVSGFIFHKRNHESIDRVNIGKRYKYICLEVDKQFGTNLYEETTFHSLRHTFCTKLHRAGTNLKTIQYLMGHKNISTSLNVYAHLENDFIQSEFMRAMEPESYTNSYTNSK